MQDVAVMVMLAPVLSPRGVLTLVRSLEADAALVPEAERGVRLEQAFARGSGHGLLVLGADEVGATLPPALSFWQKFGARYVTVLCSLPGIGERSKPEAGRRDHASPTWRVGHEIENRKQVFAASAWLSAPRGR